MTLLEIPALIDPHVHFRVPGGEYKEDWKSGSLAAARGGVTTVLDMPNNSPPCTTLEALREKKAIIDSQLELPLHYGLYLGADKEHLEEIERAHEEAVALKIFMGCSTGGLVVDTEEALDEAFARAASVDMLVAVHAEDEALLQAQKRRYAGATDPALHSEIRCPEAAIRATTLAIELAARHGARLYILHMSTKEEVELVAQAKRSGVQVFAEATTHHLFLTIDDYARWGTAVQMNPPLRTRDDQDALWEGIQNGTIDTLGTDHAPHTWKEKNLPFGQAPSGIPGVETLLPLMLDAVNSGRLTLERLIELSRTNPQRLFRLPANEDTVLIDMGREEEVSPANLRSKCGWSPYAGRVLKGWPVETHFSQGRVVERSGRLLSGVGV